MAQACRRRTIPYAIHVHAANLVNWIDSGSVERFREAYAHSSGNFFTSEENLDIVETNLAMRLPRARIIDNFFNVRAQASPAWPSAEKSWRLACVGRLNFASKGQDLILKVLSADKWRQRPLRVIFWGEDHGSEQGLRELVALYGLQDKVAHGGYSQDIEALWADHHGLLLTSRFEGSVMVLLEAMRCGRVPIVTKVGRSGHLVEDNHTGFLAAAPTVELVDEALERAWVRRHEWQAMGRLAAASIRERHSNQPVEDYVGILENMAQESGHRSCTAVNSSEQMLAKAG
jgi:glycosyltransferase involved in cell wall biosynthesis